MRDITLILKEKREVAPSVWSYVFASEEKLPPIRCGQFLHIEVGGSYLLRRPFCIHTFTDHTVEIVVATVGGGTRRMTQWRIGEKLQAVLPIGNGFTLDDTHRKIVLLGGGVGCAPLTSVAVTYPDRTYYSYLGFGTKSAVLFEEKFAAFGKTVVCTDDGSYGRKGFVTDALAADLSEIRPDVILTCGPTPMLKAAARVSAQSGIPAYMSGEARMGCGVGACLVCVCDIREKNGEIVRKRACVDGPVFSLEDIVL